MSNQRPYSIRIFVPDGDPDGLRLVEKSNWTGLGVVFNRGNFKEASKRPEFERTGIYVLVGSTEGSTLPMIYIGEGDPVKARLIQHYSKKDFWDWAMFFVTKDNSLNKAHVQRMEWNLLDVAKNAKQCRLDNRNMPTPPTLSEADTADIDSFVADMLSIFPLLGVGVFVIPTSITDSTSAKFRIDAKGIKATGLEDAKGFLVEAGSQLVADEVDSIHQYMSNLRKDLLEQGVVVPKDGHLVFTQDQVFKSPSTAAGVILGRAANGRTEWKSPDGVTLKEIQEAATEESSDE